MANLQSAQDILRYFSKWSLDEESRVYLRYHVRRFGLLLDRIRRVVQGIQVTDDDHGLRILDIGPGFQTELLRETYPNAVVSTLGFADPRFCPRAQDHHYEFDLNNAQYREKWIEIEHHDLIVMAEVIEHLYTSPALVLECVSTWGNEGASLILQTPNACALHKRVRMLRGLNPFELIRDSRANPGHFREYTVDELVTLAPRSGFSVVEYSTHNYFSGNSIAHALFNAISGVLPSGLRQGITMRLEIT